MERKDIEGASMHRYNCEGPASSLRSNPGEKPALVTLARTRSTIVFRSHLKPNSFRTTYPRINVDEEEYLHHTQNEHTKRNPDEGLNCGYPRRAVGVSD